MPRNMIEEAAANDDVSSTISLLCSVLLITDQSCARHMLSEQQYWKRMPVEARLTEIGNWLRAEAFACMESTMTARTPMAVVGTND